MSRLRRRFHSSLWKMRVEDEVAQELDFHIEMRARELVARGMSPEEARAAAVARFGDLDRVRKQCRQTARGRDRRMRVLEWWDELRQDLVFAGRQMRRAPGMTALIVAMLGLGIGANTAVFSVVNAVLLRPLPFHEPETLFRFRELTPQRDRSSVSAANYLDFVRENRTLEALGAVSFPARQFTLIGDGEPAHFRAMSIPVLMGRTFDRSERRLSEDEARETVAVISARLARRLWPEGGAVGERLQWNRPGGTVVRVIGVVGDVNDVALGSEAPLTFYFSHEQLAWPHMTLLVRTHESPAPLAPAVRRAVAEVDPVAPTAAIFPLERSVVQAAAGPRLNSQLSGGFAFLALAMACFGLYGVMSYSVSRRTQEMGVRVALGASACDLVGLVLWHGVALVAVGMVLGAAGALGLTRYLGSILYETRTTEPATFLGMGLLLCVVGALASVAPALRSARVDPVEALRAE